MKRILAWALGAVSAFVAVYVGYAHIASWHVVGEYFQPPIMERFSSEPRFREIFTEYRRGALSAQVSGAGLHVTGQTSAPDGTLSWLQFYTKDRRLEDDVAMRMRFRIADHAAYDLMVGVQRGDNPAGAREIKFGLSNHPQDPEYRLMGDFGLGGERAAGDRVLSDFRHRLAFQRPDEWHDVVLRISPETHTAHVAVDDVDAGAVDIAWWAGTPVRLAFGVVARKPGQPVDLTIEQVSYDPMIGRGKVAVFDERFDGKIIDPERWKVKLADGVRADSKIELGAGGLHLDGRALRATSGVQWLSAVRLLGRPMDLESFKLTAKFRVVELHRARVFIAMSNLLGETGIWREYAAGVRDEPDGSGAFVAGQWAGTGQLAFVTVAQPAAEQDHELILLWNAPTRTGTTWLDGKRVDSRTFDLQPLEITEIELGGDVLAPDGSFLVVVREIEFARQ